MLIPGSARNGWTWEALAPCGRTLGTLLGRILAALAKLPGWTYHAVPLLARSSCGARMSCSPLPPLFVRQVTPLHLVELPTLRCLDVTVLVRSI